MTKYGMVSSFQSSISDTTSPPVTATPTVTDASLVTITRHKLNGQNFLQWSQSLWCSFMAEGRTTSSQAHRLAQILLIRNTEHGIPRITWLCCGLSTPWRRKLEKSSSYRLHTALRRKYWRKFPPIRYRSVVEKKQILKFLLGINHSGWSLRSTLGD